MSNTIYWAADDPTVTSFQVDKSIDKGETYVATATIPANTSGVNYEAKTRRFFYLDGAGNPGDVYKLTATGSAGTSLPSYAIAPPAAPALCLIIGYCRDVFGQVDEKLKFFIETLGSKGEHWVKSPTGYLAHHPEALAIKHARMLVSPNAGGMWQVELVQGCYARVTNAETGMSHVFEVPRKEGPVNIRDIPQLRGPELALFGEQNGDRLVLPES